MLKIMDFDGREAISPQVVMADYDISRSTYYAWREKGLLPKPIKIGKYLFFWRDEVLARLMRGE
jgi:predicted DNA-binding transcriptional regulator AlpA